MNHPSNTGTLVPMAKAAVELRRLIPAGSKVTEPIAPTCQQTVSTQPRIFQVDARFEAAGTWAAVNELAEMAYISLLNMRQNAIIEEHLLELFMVLPQYRDRIQPKYPCLTDTAIPEERTRFYPVDRAYRLVHGLVGLIIEWNRVQDDDRQWIVIVRNFEHAQHLATRFFAELARRAAVNGQIDVVIEARHGWADAMLRLPSMQTVPAAQWIVELQLDAVASAEIGEAEKETLETEIACGAESLFEQRYPLLLNYYRSKGAGLAAAQIALKILIIYNGRGYYYESNKLMEMILPYFDQLVGDDEGKRLDAVSKMNNCLVMTNNPGGALSVVEDLASSYLTRPSFLAHMNYIQAMHHLRFADAKDIDRAEQHILRAVDTIRAANDDPESPHDDFLKVFIDNGLAFLRARQGRHQEALDLCQSGYEFLTTKLGEDRHRLHRSVLQYNIAQVYAMLGRLDEAIEHYRYAIAMDPNYSEYHNEVGNLLQETGRYQEAIKHYIQAIRCSAPYPEVYFNKAVCHARLEELQDAVSCFQTSLELNPDQPESYALRADLLRELGRAEEALQGYDAAISLGYDSVAVRVNRAVMHFNNRAYELALSDIEHVIALDPGESTHYENRAAIFRAMNREDLYLRDIDMAQRYREAA